jgi:hypothetical protein
VPIRLRVMKRSAELPAAINDAFKDAPTHEFGQVFLERVYDNAREAEGDFSRNILIMVLLGGGYELLARASIEKVTIGPFEVSDVSLIRRILPVLIAYYFYDACAANLRRHEMYDLGGLLFKKLFPSISQYDLEYYFSPRQSSLFGIVTYGKSWRDAVLYWASTVPGVAVLFVPTIFLYYAYQLELETFGSKDKFTWLTMVGCAYLLLLAFLTTLFTPRE